MNAYRRALAGAVSVVAIVAATPAFSGSFALKERSTIAQGLSFAGVTAGSGGIESMGFNPAAIGLVESLEKSGGLSLILPSANGSVTGGTTVDPGRLAGLANGYIGYRMEPDILVGFAMYTPFGLTTQYDAGWAGQNDALTSKLQTIVFAPTVAYEPIEELTLGASMNITYVDARLTSAATIVDGEGAFDLSFGAGVLWRPTASTQLGLAYQHGYDLEIDGTFTATGTPFSNAPAQATASLPSTISAGIVQGITDDFRIMGEVQWQNWSVFDEINISVNGFGQVGQDEQNYDDAFYFALGGEYDVNDAFTVRLGAAYDQTPTNEDFLAGQINSTTATNRTARIPDTDRVWVSIGGSYDINDHMAVNAGYSYLFGLDDARVGLRNAAPGTDVTFEAQVHIFSIGGTVKF